MTAATVGLACNPRSTIVALLSALLLGAVMMVACAPADAASLYALVDTGELFFSEDQGVTWSVRAALPCSDAIALAARESADDLYLATAGGAVYHSADAGMEWLLQGAVPAADVCAMLIRGLSEA